ncbi:hypothetical protein AK830_g2831 [Neonectria ditissima]|uniref:Uncharacterized protein n=1 Tax=Neonectria ditissima TaxID=78410 RepID=A0A0P7BQN9_9HYPO|nr:hypothetical protein AK830_g2831 [Neonectria ditissima]
MTNDYNRCACSASFPSVELLADHLAEIRSREHYHTTQLEQCQRHSVDDDSDDEQCAEVPRDPDPKSQNCRFLGCKRTKRPFEFASDFIRHFEENHRTESGRKAKYMKETFDEVSRRVTSDLYSAKAVFMERSILGSKSESKKRTWDEAVMDKEESEAPRGEIYALTTQDSQCHIDATALLSLPMDAGFPSMTIASEVIEPKGNNELGSSSAQLTYHNPIRESGGGDPYNARLLQMVSSVPFTGDFTGDFNWAERGGWGGPGNVV